MERREGVAAATIERAESYRDEPGTRNPMRGWFNKSWKIDYA
jgi:hypothetical protein